MNYQQHLALAMVALGENDPAGLRCSLDAALAEAQRVDPDGPRVAEVLSYEARIQEQAGRPAEARAALERVVAIWEHFPDLGPGLADACQRMMGFCLELKDLEGAEAWRARVGPGPGDPRR